MKSKYIINDLDLLNIGVTLKKAIENNKEEIKKSCCEEYIIFLKGLNRILKQEVKKIFDIYYSEDYDYKGEKNND